ncbi:hypothetical protein [Nocardia tengchongensis]
MTNNPAPTADTEATVRRGIIAAVLLAALFLLPVIVLQTDRTVARPRVNWPEPASRLPRLRHRRPRP